MKKPAEYAAELYHDVTGRGGLGFDGVDEETTAEMLATWATIFATCQAEAVEVCAKALENRADGLKKDYEVANGKIGESFAAAVLEDMSAWLRRAVKS